MRCRKAEWEAKRKREADGKKERGVESRLRATKTNEMEAQERENERGNRMKALMKMPF